MKCRCGYEGPDEGHPCHYDGYRCRKPATRRFYGAYLAGLAGMQMKVCMDDTWSCDECWERFQEELKKAKAPKPKA